MKGGNIWFYTCSGNCLQKLLRVREDAEELVVKESQVEKLWQQN